MPTPRLFLAAASIAALIAGPTAVGASAAHASSTEVSAGAMLAGLAVRREAHAASYDRDRFRLWIDADHDHQDTRAEVLRAESSRPVAMSANGTVETGEWLSRYDGRTITVGSKLDIDHLVPLAEAWDSGAWRWSAKKREAYANDLGYAASLVAVSKHANRSKGDDDPTEYLPPRSSYRCTYVRNWIAVKYRWHLSVDAAEAATLREVLHSDCSSLLVAKPGTPGISRLVGTSGSGSSGSTGSSGGSGSSGGGSAGTDPRYSTCTELLTHPNHAPYHRGKDVEYGWYQDRDHDGIVCE